MNHRECRGWAKGASALALSAALVTASGCDSPEPPPPAPVAPPVVAPPKADPLTQSLSASYQGESQLRLRKLSVQASGFRDAINGLMTETTDERLVTAQVAWQHLYRSFNEAWVILDCRASQSAVDAQRLARSDSFPILPGYVDGLSDWPGSGLVNDNTLILDRDNLLAQQGATSELEVSLGFQVLQFLLFGEPLAPRQVEDFVIPAPPSTEGDTGIDPTAADIAPNGAASDRAEGEADPLEAGEMMVTLSPAEQVRRRRQYLQVATQLLVDDLRLLGRDESPAIVVGNSCPLDAMASATRRLLTLANLAEHSQVSGEYLAPMSRETANSGLKNALTPWLTPDSTLAAWLQVHSPLRGAALAQAAAELGEHPVDALQALHAALTTQE